MIDQLKNTLIVSVQAAQGEALYETSIILALCESVLRGGASALRLAHVDHIRAVKAKFPSIPVIGLTKPDVLPQDPENHVYITPSLADALAIAEAGADIIAMDASVRFRPDGSTLHSIVKALRVQAPDKQLWADCDTLDSAIAAENMGFDLLSTTLAGYTKETVSRYDANTPDFELLNVLIQECSIPVVLEGRVWEPAHVAHAFKNGAHAVVVGSAITRPQLITQRFVNAAPR